MPNQEMIAQQLDQSSIIQAETSPTKSNFSLIESI